MKSSTIAGWRRCRNDNLRASEAWGPLMKVLLEGLTRWLAARDLTLDDIRGRMSQLNIADKAAFARANYIRVLPGYE